MEQNGNGSIEFDVAYHYGEYRSFVQSAIDRKLPELAAQTGKSVNGPMHRCTMALLAVVLPVVFLYKVLRVGRCRFRIDANEIRRISKNGEAVVPWNQIRAVYDCKSGLLLMKENGGLPIPDRVLSTGQRRQLRAFVDLHGLAAR
ncbi:YcxB family protein [Cognatilysobacter bugurensis]|uniref:YcxB-like C-terminal domain-containing protein n=1 Tax=Cognatilysobacter bugurensis TaxID=543356 RepID=A0A918T1K1_9GAMM|nr:YcxB family protein [Lysobacter bugurensis]GHA83891.1 hypothetical protein GCM10007067_22540 [Lysobacter bugurensis]